MLKIVQVIGMAAIAAGVFLIYIPAGFIIAGVLAFAAGELLSTDGESE